MTSHPSKSLSRRLAFCTIWLLAGSLLLGAGMMIGVSAIGPHRIKAKVDRAASDGSSTEFDLERIEALLFRSRVAGVGALVVGFGLVITRRRILPPVKTFYNNLIPDIVWSARWIKRFFEKEKLHAYSLLGILLLGLALRLWFLGQPMRTDEAWSFLDYALKPFPYAMVVYKDPNNHVLHNVLVGMVIRVLGDDPQAIRLPAMLAGWLLIGATYMTFRIMFSHWAALIAAALVATSPYLILFSTNARGYSMICLAFMLLLALSAYVLRRPDPAGWIVWAVVAALGFYVMPIMLYAMGVAWVWLVLSAWIGQCGYERAKFFRYLIASTIIAAVMTLGLYLPILVVNGASAITANKDVSPLSWHAFLTGLPDSLIGLWTKDFYTTPWPIGIFLTGSFAIGSVLHSKCARTKMPLLIAVVVAIVPVLAIQRVVPFVRVWIFLWPIYLGIAAAGLVWLCNLVTESYFTRHKIWSVVLAAVLAGGTTIAICRNQAPAAFPDTHAFREAEAVTLSLKSVIDESDRVAIDTPSRPILRYYFRRHGMSSKNFRIDPRVASRVIVVTDRKHRTIQQVLDRIHTTLDEYQTPTLLSTVGDAKVYVLEPKVMLEQGEV